MKKIFLSILMATFVLMSNAFAEDEKHNHSQHNHSHNHSGEASQSKVGGVESGGCQNNIVVSVNGLVCDFCARALEKTFGKRDDVSGIKVDLGKGEVTISLKDGMKISDEVVKNIVTDSGYNVTAINQGC